VFNPRPQDLPRVVFQLIRIHPNPDSVVLQTHSVDTHQGLVSWRVTFRRLTPRTRYMILVKIYHDDVLVSDDLTKIVVTT
jgi:hypothetical protein